MNSEMVTRAIAAQWELIEAILGPGLADFEFTLLPLLRALEENAQDQVALAGIVSLFNGYPQCRKVLYDGMVGVTAHMSKQGGNFESLQQRYRYVSVPVLFGTSRMATGSAIPSEVFGAERADNSFGIARVSIPDDHRMGRMEKPQWLKLEFREDPEKHVVLLDIEILDRASFVERAALAVGQARKKEILVFVHGYNTTFEDAARRAAQVTYDLQFEGIPALYSWPSEGAKLGYFVDANNVNWAEGHFCEFLKLVQEQTGAQVIHLIAHSMGSRLVTNTLAGKCLDDQDSTVAQLSQVVFAAPDVDAGIFRNLAPAFNGKAERFTLYASSGDKALALSQTLQKYKRAGQSGSDIVIVPSVDSIDASAVRCDFWDHSYFADGDSVLSDMFYLIRAGTDPDNRARLRVFMRYGERYWVFVPSA